MDTTTTPTTTVQSATHHNAPLRSPAELQGRIDELTQRKRHLILELFYHRQLQDHVAAAPAETYADAEAMQAAVEKAVVAAEQPDAPAPSENQSQTVTTSPAAEPVNGRARQAEALRKANARRSEAAKMKRAQAELLSKSGAQLPN